YAGNTYAVETTRHLIRIFIEFSASMQYGHDQLQRRLIFLFIDTCWNPPAIVCYGDGIIFMDNDLDIVAETSHGFVNGVIHHLVYQVVQSFDTGVTDIHRRPLTNGLQSFQYLNVICGIR